MTLNDLSSEQQEFVHLALSGKNVLCDACIGSGKTSTINVLCDAYPPERRILYLTYNRLLKLDAKDKIKNHNVLVQNYHGFASLLLNKKGIRNCGQGEQLAMVLEKKIPIPPIDTLIIDEYQDINDEIAELLKYIRSQNPNLQIVAVGDMKQKIYDDTALDVWEFMQVFLGRHEQVVFTKCFRISHDLAERLGNIWGKTINGVNSSCIVEQKLDATADAHRARLLRYEAENRGGYRVFDEIGKANTLVQHFIESCDGIPKYCITRVQDSMTLPYKKQWLEMHYPRQFLDVIGTATPERKTSVMKLLTQDAGLNAAQALYVDDYYEALNEAAKEGFTVMTVQELMLRQYTAEQ